MLLVCFLHKHPATASLWGGFDSEGAEKCSSSVGLKYISGDALRDSTDCIGPNNVPYPSATVARTFSGWSGVNNRRGRQSKFSQTMDPAVTQSALLRAYSEMNDDAPAHSRFGKCSFHYTINYSVNSWHWTLPLTGRKKKPDLKLLLLICCFENFLKLFLFFCLNQIYCDCTFSFLCWEVSCLPSLCGLPILNGHVLVFSL